VITVAAAYLVLVSTLGITFTLQATYSETRVVDLAVRSGLAAVSLFVLLSPSDFASDVASVFIIGVIAYWIVVRRKIVSGMAPPKTVAVEPELTPAPIAEIPLRRLIG
jgi:ABC-type antimicrobial peptide transport system permease subunit